MTTYKTILQSVLAITLLSLPLASQAHCGGCDAKAATHERAKAIYPLAEEAGFTTLAAAVKAAGLDVTLTEQGPFTVFAPTDAAFAKLPEGTVASLLENPEALKKVLLYHVVSGTVMAADVVALETAETLNGTRIAINAEDGVMINDANVIKTDITASNGVVHVIDTVLIPEDL
jgi:uncharacterized surface protein with fasciclin (FAS1) repeats